MKIISIQVGLPKDVTYRQTTVSTGIFKDPVKGPVYCGKLNLVGDGQADLRVHGGPDKAVYAFSFDAYPWWQQRRPNDVFSYGAFSENLTVDSMPEDQVYIGDTFEVGKAVLQVAQPRFPCFKLGIKFGDPTILKTFMQSERPGVYFRVIQEGALDYGDEFKLIHREKVLLSIKELFLMKLATLSRDRLEEIATLDSLPSNFRNKFRDELKE